MSLLRHTTSMFSIPVAKSFTAFLCALCFTQTVFAEWHYQEHQIFGTNVSIQLWSENTEQAEIAMEKSVAEMWRIHNQLSPYIEESELSQLNNNAHPGPFEISPELATLLDKSLFYSRASRGAFDITFASLGYLYDYRNGEKPNEAQIQELKKAINFRLIEFDADARQVSYLNPLVKIDLGGIAKGYAIERAVDILQSLGIEHATVTAGGDSLMLGDKRGQAWIVGIRNPRSEETAIRLPLEDFAISTSGDYERYFIDPDTDERVHHILNPATGTSAHDVASVSVIGPSAFDTDPLSTTLFVLGKDKGLEFIEQVPGYDAVFIDLNGKVHFSAGLEPPK